MPFEDAALVGRTPLLERMSVLQRAMPRHTRRGDAARRIRERLRRDDARQAFRRYADRHADVVFVQIGSHNGNDNDPLARYIDKHVGWRGVMVEPIPRQFARLQARRGGDPRLRLVQAAITDHDGSVDMTIVETDESTPHWFSQLSSIESDVILRHQHLAPDLLERLRTVQVPAMTFASLVEAMDRIDVLHIDTEGHDAKILSQVDLERWRPAIVMYESVHLEAGERARCEARLRSHGYDLVSNETDTVATRRVAVLAAAGDQSSAA
jgi:FkbM family methyltransferase